MRKEDWKPIQYVKEGGRLGVVVMVMMKKILRTGLAHPPAFIYNCITNLSFQPYHSSC